MTLAVSGQQANSAPTDGRVTFRESGRAAAALKPWSRWSSEKRLVLVREADRKCVCLPRESAGAYLLACASPKTPSARRTRKTFSPSQDLRCAAAESPYGPAPIIATSHDGTGLHSDELMAYWDAEAQVP
jgi:hypothetical protein